jgi:hypothetical protein
MTILKKNIKFFISHRGNINGVCKENENSPQYVNYALNQGFDVEIDVRIFKDKLYLGHDEPQYEISNEFVENKKFWCHAKEPGALARLAKLNCTYFWHQNDEYALCSNGYFWVYPGKQLLENSICVLPEISNYKNYNCTGVCSDYIKNYKNLF